MRIPHELRGIRIPSARKSARDARDFRALALQADWVAVCVSDSPVSGKGISCFAAGRKVM